MATRPIRTTAIEIEQDARLSALESGKAPLASPAFTGAPAAPTAAPGTNTTQLATTGFVLAALSPYAPLAGPVFTGTPSAPTAPTGTNTTQIATTGFVQASLASYAPLASPALTGTPTAPTAATATNNTQVATTAYVTAKINALINGADAAHDTFIELQNLMASDESTAAALAVTVGGKLTKSANLSDLTDFAAAAISLGLGTFRGRSVGATNATDIIDKQTGDARYAAIGASSGIAPVADRTALAAISSPANGDVRYLREKGCEGFFIFSTATLTTQVTNDPGKGVYVPPTGQSGSAGAWVRVWYDSLNVKWFTALGDGSTNDTTAIQRAINLAVTLNVAKIYLPEGVYIVTNLTLPAYAVVSGNQLKVVEFVGYAHPSILFGTQGSGYVMSTKGSILKSSATTGGAILTVSPSSGPDFSFYHLICRNLLFRTYDNPAIGAIDAHYAENVTLENVGVDTGTYSVSIASQPTNTTSAIKLAAKNNACFNYLRNVSVVGYYCGIEFEEHSNADNIFLTACSYAMFLNDSFHAMDFGRICIQNCVHGPTVIGPCRFTIRQLNLEHANTGWQQTVEDVRDVSNAGFGKIYWAVTNASTGAQGTLFRSSGCLHIECIPLTESDLRKSLFYATGTTTVADSTDVFLPFGNTYTAAGLRVRPGDAAPNTNTYIECTEPGTFAFSAHAAFPANGTGMRAIAIIKNGTSVIAGDSKQNAGAGDVTRATADRLFVNMAVGDYVRVAVKQTSGASMALPRNTDDSGYLEATMNGRTV